MAVDDILKQIRKNGYYGTSKATTQEEKDAISVCLSYNLIYWDGKNYKADTEGNKIISSGISFEDYKRRLDEDVQIDRNLKTSTIKSNNSMPRITLWTSIGSAIIAICAILVNRDTNINVNVSEVRMSERIDSLKNVVTMINDSMQAIRIQNTGSVKFPDSITTND